MVNPQMSRNQAKVFVVGEFNELKCPVIWPQFTLYSGQLLLGELIIITGQRGTAATAGECCQSLIKSGV